MVQLAIYQLGLFARSLAPDELGPSACCLATALGAGHPISKAVVGGGWGDVAGGKEWLLYSNEAMSIIFESRCLEYGMAYARSYRVRSLGGGGLRSMQWIFRVEGSVLDTWHVIRFSSMV